MIEVLEKWKDQSLGKLVPALSADQGDNPGPEDSRILPQGIKRPQSRA
jgi:hypothetical protein